MKAALALITISTLTLLLGCPFVLALRPIVGGQPVRAHRVDRPGRVLRGRHLRDGPNARWLSLAGQRNSACFASMASAVSPGNHLRVSISPSGLTAARHARRHSLDWHVCRPRELEWRQADSVPGAWRSS